ncbi:hypothetical protein PM082_021653 [Marasmius tenuissimus]|nr:hypothetical protein PM082_021653 [Marasmius tenuissimus]
MITPVSIDNHQAFVEAHLPEAKDQLDLEKDLCLSKWTIITSSLESKEMLVSLCFECTGESWNILFYPLGHPSLEFSLLEDAMLAYLTRSSWSEESEDKRPSHFAHFALAVSSYDDPIRLLVSTASDPW